MKHNNFCMCCKCYSIWWIKQPEVIITLILACMLIAGIVYAAHLEIV